MCTPYMQRWVCDSNCVRKLGKWYYTLLYVIFRAFFTQLFNEEPRCVTILTQKNFIAGREVNAIVHTVTLHLHAFIMIRREKKDFNRYILLRLPFFLSISFRGCNIRRGEEKDEGVREGERVSLQSSCYYTSR